MAAADGVEGDLSHLVVQVDPNLPVEERDRGVGRRSEGHAELVVLLQAPNLGVGLEEDPAFPLDRLAGHPNSPEAPVGLHLPVVTARGEALAAQHARVSVELARPLGPPASRSTPGGLFEVLGENHLGTRRGWIQGHVHWRTKQRRSQQPNSEVEHTRAPKIPFTGYFSGRKGEAW